MLDLVLAPVPPAAIGTPTAPTPTAIVAVAGQPAGRYLAPLPTPIGDTVYFPTGFGSLVLATLIPAPGIPRGSRDLPTLDFASRADLDLAIAFAARLGITLFALDNQEDGPCQD